MAQAAEEAIARARGAFEAAAVAESVAVRRLLAEEVRRVAAKSGEELSGFVGVVGAVLAAVVVFGAICVSAGFALGSGRGLWAAGPASGVGWRLVAWVLSAPAGWMAFALLLPGLLQVGHRGWRMAQLGLSGEERAGGWGLVWVSALGSREVVTGAEACVDMMAFGAGDVAWIQDRAGRGSPRTPTSTRSTWRRNAQAARPQV